MYLSRFAPAPTGYLHLGHVLNALHVWGIARGLNGRVLLRIEDHDRQRSRTEYERAILDDLEWLGFIPDEPALDELRAGVSLARQSDRHRIYDAALAGLRARGLVYACSCTRRELREAMAGGGFPDDVELRYSGRCAHRDLAFAPGVGVRVRLDDVEQRFDDLRHGRQVQRPAEQCGDMLVFDRDRNWTYQFVVTVDDMQQGVNLVIRGDDLLLSTGRQIQLSRLLGRDEPPHYLHHALIMKSPTQKLSKADRDTSIRDMRAAGASVEDVVGRTLHLSGLAERDVPTTRADAERIILARYQAGLESLDPTRA